MVGPTLWETLITLLSPIFLFEIDKALLPAPLLSCSSVSLAFVFSNRQMNIACRNRYVRLNISRRSTVNTWARV